MVSGVAQARGGVTGGAAMNDVKDLGVIGGKKRSSLDQNESTGAINFNQKEDSF